MTTIKVKKRSKNYISKLMEVIRKKLERIKNAQVGETLVQPDKTMDKEGMG